MHAAIRALNDLLHVLALLGRALTVCWSIHRSRCSCLNFTRRPTLMKPSFRADTQPYRVNFDMPRYSDASSIVKSLLMVPPENKRTSVTVHKIPSNTNRGSLTTPPSPHDAPACLPASDSDCTLSGCELALTEQRPGLPGAFPWAPPVQACPPRARHPASFFDAPPLCCEGWG